LRIAGIVANVAPASHDQASHFTCTRLRIAVYTIRNRIMFWKYRHEVSYARPGASAQYELSTAQLRNAISTNVNCGCAAMKLLSCSRDVEIVATHDNSSRKPATFRKLNERSSLTSSSSRNDRKVNAHSPKVRSTSTSITNASANAPAIAYFGLMPATTPIRIASPPSSTYQAQSGRSGTPRQRSGWRPRTPAGSPRTVDIEGG
jgi:hypothetical protein